ncbi:FRG domain-containing protein [Pseudomonas caspiana]|uniref:FRG domain-containing protein n=2 Tax=Pseudomonas caspiana TaxID=1451454 RepID=UPI00385C6677
MAMAQHHGVPTRLLDWTTKAYAAAYFAAGSISSRFADWKEDDRLAIWALNTDRAHRHSEIVLHRSPGSISWHLAAQGGLFSVHPHSGERRGSFFNQGA